MKAISFKAESPAQLKIELEKNLSGAFLPTLAIVFSSIEQDLKAIRDLFNTYSIAIFGATTNGEFIDEELEKGLITVMLLDLNEDYFRIYFEKFQNSNAREVGGDIAAQAQKEFENAAFLISTSNFETDTEALLKGFEDAAGEDVNVYGGIAGDDYSFSEQSVFTNDGQSNEGIICLALNEDKVTIKGRATCGWKPIGTPKTVTKSEGNKVYTVENKPVLDMTLKYGGITNVNKDTATQDTVLEISTTLPLQLQREFGDPIMRPGIKVDFDDGSFVCSGSVPQGSKIRFSVPPDFDVMEMVVNEAKDLKSSEMPDADALIVFSCAGRILALGPLMNEEVEGLKQVWNVPMIGFFSNGELARATNGKLELHNLTTCCVVLKEK